MRQIAGVRQQLKEMLFETGFIAKRRGMSKKEVCVCAFLDDILTLSQGIG
jgi:hypothetical protein